MFDIHRVELDWGGRTLILETGKIARQADGAVVATYGEIKSSGDRRRRQDAARRHRLPAAHRRLPGEVLRRRPHSGRLFQARRPSDREGDAGLAPDRPPDPSAVRRRLAQRDAGDRHHAVARSRERSRHSGAGRLVGGADAVGRAVQGTDRRRARRLLQQRIHPQPDARRDGREPARSRRRRHAGRRADGRVGSQGASRGDHARRRDVRPPPLPAGDRGDHRARREGRQGAARADRDRQRGAREGDARHRRAGPARAPTRSPTRWRATRRSMPPRPRSTAHYFPEGAESRPTTSCASAACSRSSKPRSSAGTFSTPASASTAAT